MRTISTLEATRYEIVARRPDGQTYLVGYTRRLSRPGLLAVMRSRGADLIALLEIGESDQITFGTKPRPHAKVSGSVIEFSGRTQRDCRATGEHPHF